VLKRALTQDRALDWELAMTVTRWRPSGDGARVASAEKARGKEEPRWGR
jgi:hypothetical protein